MTNKEIWAIARQQSAIDCCCEAEDFLKQEPVVVLSGIQKKARKYLELPFDCHLVSYGNNVVASVSEGMRQTVADYIKDYPAEHCFETPAIQILNDRLLKQDLKICFMAEYFLPRIELLHPLACNYTIKSLKQSDFSALYTPMWSNALCEKRKELDILGFGAYDGDRLVGLAACSADCDIMYQIGIDVLPDYRKQGIASALTSRLALEILALGKVPFYCAAWCNIKSVRNAITCGFRPAWVELTAKPSIFVDRLNDTLYL